MKFMFLQDFTKNSINGTTESQKLITADKNEKRGSFKILDKNIFTKFENFVKK